MASSRNNNDLLFDDGLVSSTEASDLSDRYIDYLRSNKGLGSRTLLAYRVDVLQCLEWCGVNDLSDLNSVSTSVLRQWMYWLNKNHARSSLARKVVAVRGFFAWATHVGLISANPAQILNTPKIVNELPTVLDEAQAEKLLDCAEDRSEDYAVDKSPATEHQENTPLKSQIKMRIKSKIKSQTETKQEYVIALRNAAILELLYATGMRVGELTSINVQDMDFENHTVKVTGKGNKQRVVPFGVPAAKACKKWLDCGRSAL
ncbi:recombinase XerC, partial [Gardnerella vaginalis]